MFVRAQYVREHGVLQFIHRYHSVVSIANDELKWGDEIEYSIVDCDHKAKKTRISLNASAVRESLMAKEVTAAVEGCAWMPEYGAWMLEGTPKTPYNGYSVRWAHTHTHTQCHTLTHSHTHTLTHHHRTTCCAWSGTCGCGAHDFCTH